MKYIKLYEQEQPEHTVTRRKDGSIKSEWWHLNDQWHREDGPAQIGYYPDGSIEQEQWYLNGEQHREHGPAWIAYRPDGSIEQEVWFLNDKRHREGGPAWIRYRPDGSIERERWYLEGDLAEGITDQEEFEAWKYLKSVGLV